MIRGIIVDLDQTIVDSRIADYARSGRNWKEVYSLIPKFRLYEKVTSSLLNVHNQGVKICIVTSSPESYCKKVLSYWDIPYTHTVCYHDTRKHKPDPEPFHLALERMGINNIECLSAGDDEKDIIASTNAGIKSIACLWGSLNPTQLMNRKATYIASSEVAFEKILSNF